MRADWSIYISFIGAGLVLLLPRNAKSLIRWTALLTGVAALAVALVGYFSYNSWIKAGNAGLWDVVIFRGFLRLARQSRGLARTTTSL